MLTQNIFARHKGAFDSMKRKKSILLKIWYAVLVLLLLFALSRFDLHSLLHSIRQISVWSVVLLIGLQIVSQLLINVQWNRVAKIADIRMSFWEMLYVNCQGAVMDSITPGVKIGGEVTRAVQISRTGKCSAEHATAIVSIQKLFSIGVFLIFSMFSVVYLMREVPDLWMAALGLVVMILLIAAIIFALRKKLKSFLHNLRNQLKSLAKNPRAIVLLSALSALIWLLYPIKMLVLTMQIYPEPAVIYIGAVTFIAYMVAMIPIFPGGLGGFEATMVGLLLSAGFMQSDALVVTVLFRFFTFWFVLLLSLMFIGFYKIHKQSS